ncbi:hypothetical protein D3C75_915610 [compost metagenome]
MKAPSCRIQLPWAGAAAAGAGVAAWVVILLAMRSSMDLIWPACGLLSTGFFTSTGLGGTGLGLGCSTGFLATTSGLGTGLGSGLAAVWVAGCAWAAAEA